ncbi:hypothetical protein [Pseudomonas schmalbachii]|uniref:Transcriptional regulator SutA RNAP-binding domain-containing protein n=1 Tax=Pseudomonas schmalbachii TaxID=2816993 RepID=A0ABS3TPX7_9PSED|nr:hypothetical protein [Pseudomonas schmalbachii]MBO3275721.1 hypothetical protein [Pseudomonas schmalbachii]
MSSKPVTRQKSMPKPPPAVETRESLEAQVAAFLNGGGQIQQIAKGVSGQNYAAPSRHISLGKK